MSEGIGFSGSTDSTPRGELLGALRQAMRRLEGARHGPTARQGISSGCEALDRLLPSRGFVRGTLVEWLGVGRGSGAGTLALLAAREACRQGGPLVVIDRRRRFYPPAADRWGIDLSGVLWVRPAYRAEECWALDQALRSPHVAAVLSWTERLDPRTFRRLQLAAQQGGGLGLLVRPPIARAEPSWADIRWLVCPRASQGGWRLEVELLRLRGGPGQGRVELEIAEPSGSIHEADPLPLVSELACAAAARCQAGA